MKTKLFKLVLLGFLVSPLITGYSQEAFFEGLGYLPTTANLYSKAEGVSEDGSIVIGTSSVGEESREAFRWENGEMLGLGSLHPNPNDFYSQAYAISADGSVIVGHSRSENSFSGGYEAMMWNEEEGMQGLGDFAPPFFNEATDVSSDGTIIVGRSFFTGQGFRWEDGVMENMTDGDNFLGWAMGVSADGSVVVGTGVVDDLIQACLWQEGEGIIGLGGADTSTTSTAYKVSADGSIVVGVKANEDDSLEAFLWTQEDGMTGLGFLSSNQMASEALDLSDDGSIIVGYSVNDEGDDEAFIWMEGTGMRNLKEVLENDYDLDLTGWDLRRANAITGNGNVIVGLGINPDGNFEAWRVEISEYMSTGDFFQNKLILYPNPTTGIINIETEEPVERAEVYTLTGSKLPAQLSETGKTIDISDLSTGIYFVRITANNQSQTYKVIKE